ncbi:MAG: hypothetical protein PHH28_03330 [Desulfuromonadaceae bacterium]|nr:hypothetical protein [Desulfuromonadaceae bacterium]
MTVAVLFARQDSVYKSLPGCDVFDIDRDARCYPGANPVVAHPLCRSWGRLRKFAKPRDDERDLAVFAVDQVRKYGGVLEHPLGSELWSFCDLPLPGRVDSFGGFTLGINQNWFGHRAEKKTLLYIVGVLPGNIPPVPFTLEYASHVIARNNRNKNYRPPLVSKSEREHTPPAFAEWLVDLAKRCGGAQ